MGLFNLFRRRPKPIPKQPHKRRRGPQKTRRRKPSSIHGQIKTLKTELSAMNDTLRKHSEQLTQHDSLLTDHTSSLEGLEDKLNSTPPTPIISKLAQPMQVSVPLTHAPDSSSAALDVALLSQQEKRILKVFTQNHSMYLSYQDVAKSLNKSPNTVKNQMNGLRLKANLFDRTIGEQSRSRFRLKEDLRIERYLNMGQATKPAESTTQTGQSIECV